MDNFKSIYKILKILEKAMDVEEFDSNSISAEVLGISQSRWIAIMEMLTDDGYIKGALISNSLGGKSVRTECVKITLKGLEYLSDNSFMKKTSELANGIADLIP